MSARLSAKPDVVVPLTMAALASSAVKLKGDPPMRAVTTSMSVESTYPLGSYEASPMIRTR